jgi:signal transduction histidine kinase
LIILDQAASLIGLLVIFWLWNFPEPDRVVDLVTLALLILASVVLILQTVILPGVEEQLTGSPLIWKGASITALVIGIGLILIRKPNYWEYGLLMGLILAVGAFSALFTEDIIPLHLAQLTAYPLLLLLGDRFPIGLRQYDDQMEDDEEHQKPLKASVEYDQLKLIQNLFDEDDSTGILYKIAKATAYLILSDLSLLIDTPDKHGKMRIIAGYDLIRDEPLQALTLDSRSIPLLSNYIQRGKMLHIPASSTSRDLSHLSKVLQLTKPGHLLASPVYIPSANKTIGVVLFSPFSNRPWTKADQDYISLLCKLFQSAFSNHFMAQDGESEEVKNTIRELTSQLTELTQEKQVIKEDMAVLSKDHQNLLLDYDTLTTKFDEVALWRNALERHLSMLVDLSKKESTEALRKYIGVIEKEVKKAVETEDSARVPKEVPEPIASPEDSSQEEDPDSTRPADLVAAIHSCLDEVQSDINNKNITTKLTLPDETPLLKMNHALFREIFSFLVDNAIEENPAGGEISIKTQIYQEDESQHFAHIKISDLGEGYYPDQISAILNNNLTVDQQQQFSQVMTNLYVTKNLVENEGGRMWVESKPGGGTTVSLLLAFL